MQESKDPLRQYAIRATLEHIKRDQSTPQTETPCFRAKSYPEPSPINAYSKNPFNKPEDDGEYELNKNAVFCCLAIILLVIAGIWFALASSTAAPKVSSELGAEADHANSTAVHTIRKIEFSLFQNLTTPEEKRNFLQSELSSLLSKYNGSISEIELSYNRMWMMANHSNLTGFSNLYRTLIDRYQDFFRAFNCAQTDYQTMRGISTQYNEIEEKIQSNREKMITLLQKQDEFEIEHTRVNNEIEKLRDLQEEQKRLFEIDKEKLKNSQLEVQRHIEEIKVLDCDELLRKQEDYKGNKVSLEKDIENYKQQLQTLENLIREGQSRIQSLDQLIQEKEKSKEVADLDYRTLLNMRDMMAELDKFESEQASQLRSRMLDTLNILKEKFQLLAQTGELDSTDHEHEKLFYQNATQILKQHVQLLVKMKSVYQNETKLVFEGLKLHGNPDEIERRQCELEKELKGLKNDFERWREQLELDQNDRTRAEQALGDSQRNLSGIIAKLEAIGEVANHCLEKMKQRDQAIEEYERKKNETYTHYKITFNSLEDEYKDRVAEEGEYIERMKLVNVEINELQTQISGLVSTLAQNFHKFNEDRHSFAEKTQRASDAYNDVQHFKQKLIEHLNNLDEMKPAN